MIFILSSLFRLFVSIMIIVLMIIDLVIVVLDEFHYFCHSNYHYFCIISIVHLRKKTPSFHFISTLILSHPSSHLSPSPSLSHSLSHFMFSILLYSTTLYVRTVLYCTVLCSQRYLSDTVGAR